MQNDKFTLLRWAQIAKHLPGRTDNEVKNFWNSTIKKKLLLRSLKKTNPNPDKAVDYKAVMSLMPKPSIQVPTNSNSNSPLSNNFPYLHDPPNFKPDETLMFGFDYSNPTLLNDHDSAMFMPELAEMSKMPDFGLLSPPPPLTPEEVMPVNHIKNIESLMPSFAHSPHTVYLPWGNGGDTSFPSTTWGFY